MGSALRVQRRWQHLEDLQLRWAHRDDGGLSFGDVFDVDAADVPDADIAWASNSCTDLSLVGKRGGLVDGPESRAFFGFIDVIENMGGRAPRAVVLENVCGLASSHEGNDFRMVVEAFNRLGYSVDAFELNARRWIPQSRPRMFVVGVKDPVGGEIDTSIRPDRLAWIHSDPELKTHITPVEEAPVLLSGSFTEIAEKLSDDDPRWWDAKRSKAFVDSLSDIQRERFDLLKSASETVARTAYRRTRAGKPVWEIREAFMSRPPQITYTTWCCLNTRTARVPMPTSISGSSSDFLQCSREEAGRFADQISRCAFLPWEDASGSRRHASAPELYFPQPELLRLLAPSGDARFVDMASCLESVGAENEADFEDFLDRLGIMRSVLAARARAIA